MITNLLLYAYVRTLSSQKDIEFRSLENGLETFILRHPVYLFLKLMDSWLGKYLSDTKVRLWHQKNTEIINQWYDSSNSKYHVGYVMAHLESLCKLDQVVAVFHIPELLIYLRAINAHSVIGMTAFAYDTLGQKEFLVYTQTLKDKDALCIYFDSYISS